MMNKEAKKTYVEEMKKNFTQRVSNDSSISRIKCE